ncbi:hypothetical protein E5D57_011405 [Metarhizium anisopliae]|nr:hypothetical protein E5D57_011405 [Metarhizium anisopliae]
MLLEGEFGQRSLVAQDRKRRHGSVLLRAWRAGRTRDYGDGRRGRLLGEGAVCRVAGSPGRKGDERWPMFSGGRVGRGLMKARPRGCECRMDWRVNRQRAFGCDACLRHANAAAGDHRSGLGSGWAVDNSRSERDRSAGHEMTARCAACDSKAAERESSELMTMR